MFNSGNNPSLVKTELDELFYSKYDYPTGPGIARADNTDLFRQLRIDRQAVITEEWQGPGDFEEHAEEEELDLATIRSGNQATRTVSNYKKTLKIPKEFADDDQWDTISRAVQDSGRRARTTQDKNAFNLYAGGFDSVTTNDGAYLWSNSHTALNGDTIDNLETGSLTPANLEILVRKLIEQKAQDGGLGGHQPVALLVPPALFPDAQEITKSELQPNSTDNNLNYFSAIYPGLKVYTNPYVGAAYHSYTNANTAYYLVSQNHSITRWIREDVYTRIVSWEYDDKDRWTYKMGFREVLGAISWEGAVASSGTT